MRNLEVKSHRSRGPEWGATPTRPWLATALLTTTFLVVPLANDARAQDGEFDEADVYAELNDTDEDLGFHALIDGDAWDLVEIRDPDGQLILSVEPTQSLADQGMTELFFESEEPEFDELTPEEFFERFPEGIYEVTGRTVEGDDLASEAKFKHLMPAPPGNIQVNGEDVPEDCDEDPLPEVSDPVIITWDPVTTPHPDVGSEGDGTIKIVNYQVVVEREEPKLRIYSVDLPSSVTSVEVPQSFIELGEEFKLEIIARAKNGNQTATETCFAIE